MFSSLGIKAEQIYGDVYASWLRDTFEKSSAETKQFFRDMVEAGFRDRQVVLRRQRLGVNVISSLATAVHRSALTKLDVHGNALRDIGCEVVAHLMPDLPHLTYLDLGANGITSAGARSLGLAVAQHQKLAVLILSSRRGRDPYANALTAHAAGTAVLLHGCLRSRSLRQLDLSGNPLGDAAAVAEDRGAGGRSGGSGGTAAGKVHDPLEGIATALGGGDDRGDEGEGFHNGKGAAGEPVQSPVEILCQILTRATGPSLTLLRLSNVDLSSRNACRLIAALQSNTSLTTLDLSENQLPPAVGDAIGQLLLDRVAMHNGCALHTLCLSGNPLFPSAEAPAAAGAGGETGGLKGRRLFTAIAANASGTGPAFPTAAHFGATDTANSAFLSSSLSSVTPSSLLLSSLANDRMLTTLDLDGCGAGATAAAMNCLCRALTTNPALQSLSLRNSGITAEAAVELGRALCRHPCLQKLYLSGNVIEDEGACALAAVVEGDRGELSRTAPTWSTAQVGDGEDGAARAGESASGSAETKAGPFGRSVSFSPDILRVKTANGGDRGAGSGSGGDSSLEVLDLQHTWLGDRGLVALGVALQGNRTLRVLLLGGNHFTSQGGESFAALLEQNASVVSCDLGATSVPCPTLLRLERCIARNRHKLEHAESDELRREVVRLHFQKYKLEEAKIELENLRERSAVTRATAENYEMQFAQDRSEYAKKTRQLEEQMESYASQEQRYVQQAQQLEADLKKSEVLFEEDMAAMKERLEAEVRNREKVEQEHRAVEAELEDWKNNAPERERARRARVAALQNEIHQWADQRKQYRQESDALAKELKELEAKAAQLRGGSGGGRKERGSSVKKGKARA